MRIRGYAALVLLLFAVCSLTACGGKAEPGVTVEENHTSAVEAGRDNTPSVPEASADGAVVYQQGDATVDASHLAEGYVMVSYAGQETGAKAQVTTPAGTVYTYTLQEGFNTLPLTEGDGGYQVAVFRHVEGDQYAMALQQQLTVTLEDEFAPFLAPNQYVDYSADSETVRQASSLAEGAASDLEVVANVYHYIIGNITYDQEKAEQVSAGSLTGYLPVVDEVLESGKGICFDYAALMTAMLRSQRIPTRMELGYSGDAYHAWISTYVQDIGWIDNIIEFDGKSWKLMDPTFAASGGDEIMDYIGDGENYVTRFTY